MSDYDVHHDENLRRQVEDAYRPIDLFDKEKGCFVCPKCNEQLSLSSARPVENKFNKFLVQASCSACKEWLCFKLPAIKKKRVYLDQSVISDLCVLDVAGLNEISSTDWRERLLAKILLAKRLQKARFIVSEIHALETIVVPKEDKKYAIWKFANELADGRISGGFIDAFEYELHQILGDLSVKNHTTAVNCYTNFEIDAWSIRNPFQRTNSSLLNLNQGQKEFRNASTENFKRILESQREQVELNLALEKCIQYLKNVYLDDIVDGIKCVLQLATCSRISSGLENPNQISIEFDPLGIHRSLSNNPYSLIIFSATDNYRNADKQITALSELLKQVELRGLDAFPTLKIETVLMGVVLHKWLGGTRLNKFNTNYGSSKFMDVSHLAVFLPVVDVLTVDSDTFNTCNKQPEIKSEFTKYPCKLLLASENQSGLENWLDDLLAEPETDEFRCARRLFFGRNLAEEKYHEEKFILDILDSLESDKKTSL